MIGPRLPFLLPWVRVHPLIRSIRAKTWNDATWPTVKVMLGRALDMRRRINREGWWSYTALVAGSAPPSASSSSRPARPSCSSYTAGSTPGPASG